MNDTGMFVTTLAAIVALGGVLYALMRAEISSLQTQMSARFDVVDARLIAVETTLRPISEHFLVLGLAASVGKRPDDSTA